METITPVKLEVKRYPGKRGYTIYHNQKIGWKGTMGTYFGWYKSKEDAAKTALALENQYNKT